MIKYFFILIFFAATLFAQDDGSSEILSVIEKRFDKIEDFSAEFLQETKSSYVKNGMKIFGSIKYKKGDKFVIAFSGRELISNGSTVWNYDIAKNKVVISNRTDDPSAFSFEKFVYDYPSKCEVKSLNNENALFLYPKEDLGFKSAKISYDKTFLVTKIEIIDFNETLYLVELKNIKMNNNFSDEIFEFDNKEGMKVIDLR